MNKLINCTIENRVLKIELNRKEKMNALSLEFFKELEKEFLEIEEKNIMGVYLTSSHPKAFCAGGDERYDSRRR